jgi:glutamyl-tRNA synthetase
VRMSHRPIEAVDRMHGRFAQDVSETVGDIVARRSDGLYAYQLAVVVDDAADGVTDVVRGDDLLASTPRQIALQRMLGLPTPSYAHVPLVVGADGERLAKRHAAPPVAALRDDGVPAERVVAWLAESAGLGGGGQQLRASDLIDGFSLDRVRAQQVQLF